MSKNSTRPTGSNRGEFPIFAGILLGIIMGLALAGVIAWLLLKKNPVTVPPVKEIPQASKSATTPDKTPAPDKSGNGKSGAAGAAGTAEGKARFEFYKELTGKPETSHAKQTDPSTAKHVASVKQTEPGAVYFLQEGAYTSMEDAEKVKAKLALIGMMANIQPANIPDKGLWYRVRLGPYKTPAERDEALATLKLNGLNAAPIKVQ